MRSEWILEYQDYLAAQDLFNRGSLWRRFSIFTIKWMLPGFAVLLVLLLVTGHLLDPERNSWNAVITCWPFVLFVSIMRFFYWFNLKQVYKRIFLNGDSTKPVYMEIDDERVLSGIPGSSEGKFLWPAIIKFSENDHIALLHVSKCLFLMIPKNKLHPEQWLEMKQTIQRHVSAPR